MNSYKKAQDSSHDLTKHEIYSILRPKVYLVSIFGEKLKKTFSFDDMVHYIDEENMATYVYFDRGITFYTETTTKIGQNN